MPSMEYVLVAGAIGAGFLGLALMLLRALVAATEIETLLLSLPVG